MPGLGHFLYLPCSVSVSYLDFNFSHIIISCMHWSVTKLVFPLCLYFLLTLLLYCLFHSKNLKFAFERGCNNKSIFFIQRIKGLKRYGFLDGEAHDRLFVSVKHLHSPDVCLQMKKSGNNAFKILMLDKWEVKFQSTCRQCNQHVAVSLHCTVLDILKWSLALFPLLF